jgi:hypothetical protein
MNAASVGRLAGIAEVARRIPVLEIGVGIEPANGIARDGGEFLLALGAFIESGLESVLFPIAQGGRGVPGGGNFCLGRITHVQALPEREIATNASKGE